MEKIYNKLVRDNIPEIIRSNNGGPDSMCLLNLLLEQKEKKIKMVGFKEGYY